MMSGMIAEGGSLDDREEPAVYDTLQEGNPANSRRKKIVSNGTARTEISAEFRDLLASRNVSEANLERDARPDPIL